MPPSPVINGLRLASHPSNSIPPLATVEVRQMYQNVQRRSTEPLVSELERCAGQDQEAAPPWSDRARAMSPLCNLATVAHQAIEGRAWIVGGQGDAQLLLHLAGPLRRRQRCCAGCGHGGLSCSRNAFCLTGPARCWPCYGTRPLIESCRGSRYRPVSWLTITARTTS